MTIVSYTHRPKRARKRAQSVAIAGPRIVTAKAPKAPRYVASARAEEPDQNMPSSREASPAPPAARKSAIVTARSPKAGRFGPVQDIDAEEHQRRGDAAVELFREIVRRATGDSGS